MTTNKTLSVKLPPPGVPYKWEIVSRAAPVLMAGVIDGGEYTADEIVDAAAGLYEEILRQAEEDTK